MTAPIGFVGLGQMGGPMSRRLLAAGHRLVVHDLRAEAMDGWPEKASTRPVAGRGADRAGIVLVSLPTPEVVRAVALGPDGLIHGGALRICVDLSTTGQTVAAEVAAALAGRGITTWTRRSRAACAARPGHARGHGRRAGAELERVRPLLEVFGRVFHVGEARGPRPADEARQQFPLGDGDRGDRRSRGARGQGGLAPAVMEVINASTGRNTASEDKFPRRVLTGRYAAGHGRSR